MKRMSDVKALLCLMFFLCVTTKTVSATVGSIKRPILTPVMFGAKADDDVDDSKAFQKCLNEARNRNATIISIPPGKYVISNELRLEETTNLIIEGGGAVLIKPANSSSNIFFGYYNSQITIRDVVFEGNRSNEFEEQWPHKMNACAILGKSSGVRFENCIVKDFHYGVCLGTSTENGYDVWIQNCQFFNCGSDIDLYGKPSVHIMGNSSHNCTGHSIQIEPPYTRESDLYDYNDQPQIDALSIGNIISNNTIDGCKGNGIVIFGGCENITITNNQIINYGSVGILTNDGASNILIQNNIISNSRNDILNNRPWTSSGAGIVITKVINSIVTGNLVCHANTGIFVFGTSGAVVSNNKVANSKDAGICLYEAKLCVLVGNQVDCYNQNKSWWANSGVVIYHSSDINISESTIVGKGDNDFSIYSLESERIRVNNIAGYGFKTSLTYPKSLSK